MRGGVEQESCLAANARKLTPGRALEAANPPTKQKAFAGQYSQKVTKPVQGVVPEEGK
jgi:hypothetical protein